MAFRINHRMKKSILLFMIGLSLTANAQLTGSFQNMKDGHVYFVLTNPTRFNLYVSWWATNSITNEQLNNGFILGAGNSAYFGPSTIGWTWIKGERFTVVVNASTGYWECPRTDPSVRNSNPSFRSSSSACTLCRSTYCSGFKGKKDMNARCQNSSCGHTWQQHKW